METPKLTNYSRILLALLLVLGLALLAYYFLFVFGGRQGGSNKAKVVFTKNDVNLGQDPDGFPAGIPIEAGVKVLQNYNATTSDGRTQATKVLETKRTSTENSKIYTEYAKSAGWKVLSQDIKPDSMVLYATKDDNRLQIFMTKDNTSNVNTLSISVTSLQK